MNAYGIDTWIYISLPIEEALKRLEEKGIKYIEFSYEHFSNLKKREDFLRRAKEVNEVLSTLTIKPIQMHAIFGEIDSRLCSKDTSVREKEFCSLLDSEVLVVHTAMDKLQLNEDFTNFCNRLRDANIQAFSVLVKHASEYNIKLAVENRLENIFGATPRDLIALIEETDPDFIGVCFDTGHANVRGLNLIEFVKEIKDYLIATHIHDNNGRNDLHLPPLMGNISWHQLMKIMKTSYNKPLILEIAGHKDIAICDNHIELSKVVMNYLL